jgi:hypothetical protein
MSDSPPDQATGNSTLACARCKKAYPESELQHLPRLPLFILSLVHMHPGAEGDRLYCADCYHTLSFCLGFLVLVGSAGTAIAILTSLFK